MIRAELGDLLVARGGEARWAARGGGLRLDELGEAEVKNLDPAVLRDVHSL